MKSIKECELYKIYKGNKKYFCKPFKPESQRDIYTSM